MDQLCIFFFRDDDVDIRKLSVSRHKIQYILTRGMLSLIIKLDLTNIEKSLCNHNKMGMNMFFLHYRRYIEHH